MSQENEKSFYHHSVTFFQLFSHCEILSWHNGTSIFPIICPANIFRLDITQRRCYPVNYTYLQNAKQLPTIGPHSNSCRALAPPRTGSWSPVGVAKLLQGRLYIGFWLPYRDKMFRWDKMSYLCEKLTFH